MVGIEFTVLLSFLWIKQSCLNLFGLGNQGPNTWLKLSLVNYG